MKTKRLLSLSLATLIATSTILTGCGQDVVKKVDEIGTISSVELVQANKEDTVLPTYDINAIEQSIKPVSFNIGTSYFASQLDTRNGIVYTDIRNAYSEFKPEVILSKTVTEEELFKIMSIMYIDDPEMFQMKTTYDYYLDTNGYVYKVNLYYSTTPITYTSDLDRINNSLLGLYSDVYSAYKDPTTAYEYEVVNKIIKLIEEIQINTSDTKILSVANYTEKSRGWSAQSLSKYLTLCMRYFGIDTATLIGRYTNETYTKDLTLPSNYDFDSYADVAEKYTKTSDENGTTKYSVSYDYNDYAFWNIIKINDNWYHFDYSLTNYLFWNNPDFKRTELGLLEFVPDYTISESRLFYYSDNLLGAVPLCTSNQFQYSYRNSFYLLHHSEEQMLTYLTQIVDVLPSRNTERMVYQFVDEETYNYFINHFDDVVTAFNNDSLNKIMNYSINEYRSELTIIINNFEYRQ